MAVKSDSAGWDPDNDPPPREAVERARVWCEEQIRASGRVIVERLKLDSAGGIVERMKV